ncbi:hypothetical protein J8I29_11845 [Labrys sp. LIt4]|nr:MULTISPECIES: DUF1127 domain-containing protein [Labrys]MBP0580003.1 hypothetical protein [Labrys sp. LIt4]
MNSVVVNSQSSSFVSSFVETVRAVFGKVAGLAVALHNRREINQLATADAAMLRDLGLTPTDVEGALSQPLWRDPSAQLVAAQMDWRSSAKAAKHDNFVGLHA